MSPLTTSALPMLPLDAGVVLPGMTITLALETPDARAAVDAAEGAGGQLLLVPRRGRGDGPDATDGRLARVGTVASVERRGELPGGTLAVVVRGLQRASLGPVTSADGPASWATVEALVEPPATEEMGHAPARELRAVFDAIAEHRGYGRLSDLLRGVSDPGALADAAGYWPDLSLERKIELLETVEPDRRVQLVLGWSRQTLAELELKDRIRSDVAEGMERTQREYLLRQQLAAIRKELGDDDGGTATADYRERLAALEVPDATRTTIAREIDKLERISEQSPEHGWIRTWLDTVFDLPWGRRSSDQLDVVRARAVLDADHTGLDDVKDRIVEHLAVRKLRHQRGLDTPAAPDAVGSGSVPPSRAAGRRGGGGMILALVGPPGVGKTSLGESVARAMDRSFVRVALGGVRDEAEIRGHRRTYVGALPGRIVRALKEAGTLNPVVLLDEVDKLGSDWRGDPSSALLEVLDPAQNHTFRDHYLDVDLDLSEVLFLATANVAEQIPDPLLDRMEVVRLDGYTEDEKVAIAREHLMARQLERTGLRPAEVVVTDDALRTIAAGYTHEAGVRALERQLGTLLRKAAAKVAAEDGGHAGPVVVDGSDVSFWLGRPRFTPEAAERTSSPGVATGLAVTGFGGDVLFVEASASDGEPGLTVTGQLGDVMQESAQIALSYVRSHTGPLGLPPGAFEHRRVHVHVPAGAVPKDGPSAGVTMTTALVSMLSGRAVRPEVGMTGEVTLQGKVLPIGGVKQKVLAAHRAGLTEVVLPARNEPDLEDVPVAVREQMTFHLASDVREVLEMALEPLVESVSPGDGGGAPR
ncbi:MAG: endopeptidase La [Acidimicrobiales bacterium]